MINIIEKSTCCGCEACVQVCPHKCISLKTDKEGFSYPVADTKSCIECGLCEKVCPKLYSFEQRHPLAFYAAINPNEDIRMQSSSGGIFTLLAEHIIQLGGVVFGARFNSKWEVVHGYTDKIECLSEFRGSKYVQSHIGNAYKLVEQFLKAGRLVLFSGTPCQVAGLYRFIRKDYKNLVTVDFVCHGVPSPKVYAKYLREISCGRTINSISFRDKRKGWKGYHVVVNFESGVNLVEPFVKNSYMQGFLRNLFLRPSCYVCKAQEGASNSDFTLGDFWGADKICPKLDDDKGLSLIAVNSLRAQEMLNEMNVCLFPQNSLEVAKYNPSMVKPASININRAFFFSMFRYLEYHSALKLTISDSLPNRFFRRIYRVI